MKRSQQRTSMGRPVHNSWRDDKRTSAQRGYGNRWKKARATYLNNNPLCAMCKRHGHVTAATVVDHIEPHRGDQALFWNKANWQPLCKRCHDSTKQRIEKRGYEIGCDDEGLPLNPSHHWR